MIEVWKFTKNTNSVQIIHCNINERFIFLVIRSMQMMYVHYICKAYSFDMSLSYCFYKYCFYKEYEKTFEMKFLYASK